jgi:CspA family cold shock protein
MPRIRGQVKWFNEQKGYGFIEREGGGKDVFLHISELEKAGMTTVKEGETLTFELENKPKGQQATDLKRV